MKRFTIIAVVAALAFGGIAGHANAVVLTEASDEYVGSYTPPEPASPTEEVGYINNLIQVDPGATKSDFGDGVTYSRVGSDIAKAALPTATTTDADRDDTGASTIDLMDMFYQYVIGKYDGPNGGALVWFSEDGFTGEVTLPSAAFSQPYGISHISVYNKTDGPDERPVIPEPTSILVWSGLTALIGMVAYRRRRRS